MVVLCAAQLGDGRSQTAWADVCLAARVVAGTKLEVRGLDKIPKGACLVVAKHQSAWDTFALVPLFRDPAIVLKDELKWISVLWLVLHQVSSTSSSNVIRRRGL